ncbi:Gfo/Idh/MocA family oxidoreductase [Nocardia sp. NPDC024068]|uniref:Gfo/Idh/MocA family protein n=1 Tax=Nocardia sp. NPDC024068 TaxID=3157197 RepID=UPI0033E5759B
MSIRGIAIVGASSAVAPRHTEAFGALPSTEIRALVEIDPGKAELLRAAHPDIPVFGSIAEVSAPIDLAVVCVPDPAHGPVVTECLDRGWHVLCEKPLTDDIAMAEQLFARADKSGLFLAVAYQRRHMLAELGDLVAAGLIGDLYWVNAWWMRRSGHPDSRRGMFRRGDGVRGDLVPHMLSQTLRFLAPGQLTVVARDWQINTGWGSEDTARVTIRDGADVELQIHAAYDAPHVSTSDDCGITLYGTLGSIHVDLPTDQDSRWARNNPPILYPRNGSAVRRLAPVPTTAECHLLQAGAVSGGLSSGPAPATIRDQEMTLVRTVAAAQASATWDGVAIPVHHALADRGAHRSMC